MSTDIARLAFSVDTQALAAAIVELMKVEKAAGKAETGAEQLETAFEQTAAAANQASAAVAKTKNAADQAATGMGKAANAATAVAAGMGKSATAANAAASADDKLAGAANRAATGNMNQASAADRAAAANGNAANAAAKNAASTKAAGDAADVAAGKLARLGAAANNNLNAVQATPANIAAQFQDIGVTAAAGLNPMLIALQQGTQLSAAFAGPGGLKSIMEALGQVFSPLSLFTIGIVGLVAALIQMVDWASVGKAALNGIADVVEVATPYLLAFAAGLILIYSPAIITGLWSLATALYGVAAGLLATIGLPVLLVAGLVAVVAAANYFRDELTTIFGYDIVAAAKDGINFIVAGFVGAYNTVRQVWSILPQAMGEYAINAANNMISAIEQGIRGAIARLSPLLAIAQSVGVGLGAIPSVTLGRIDNPYAGSAAGVGAVASREMNAARGTDYVGGAVDTVSGWGRDAAAWLRERASGIGAGDSNKDGASRAASGGKTDAEKFDEITAAADRQIAALRAAQEQIGLYGEALYTAQAQQTMLNKAAEQGITLDERQRATIAAKAAAIGQLTAENERLKFMEESRVSHERVMTNYAQEIQYLGMTASQVRALRIENELLNDAKAKGITLSDAERATISQRATDQAAAGDDVDRSKFMHDVAEQYRERMIAIAEETSYLTMNTDEVRRARIENEMLRQARQNNIDLTPAEIAAIRAAAGEQAEATKQFERMRDAMEFSKKTVRGFFQDIYDGVKQGKGLFESLGDAIVNTINRIVDKIVSSAIDQLIENMFSTSGGGGGGFSNFVSQIGMMFAGGSAKGNAFGSGGVTEFAKGGSFTNRMVDSPTFFAFANGSAFGVMGEAGPEAVMPLKRGADGSLGVQMYGGSRGNNGPAVINVAVNNYHQLTGAISSADIVELNKQSAERTKEELKRSLPAVINQYTRDGTLV